MKRLFLVLLTLVGANASYGQLLHNDPFKIDNFLYLDIEYSHLEIVKNKILSVEKCSYNLNKEGNRKGKINTLYSISFNKAGYPITFHKTYIMNVWWLYKLSPPHYYYDYYFSYDSLNRLVSVKEMIKENKHSHDENDVYYTYDRKGNVIQIVYSKKHIYKKGFKYRGVTYPNDTSLTETTLVYNNSIVSLLLGKSSESGEKSIRYDTSFVNTTFDSLFISKNEQKGVKKDSDGHVIKVVSFKRLGKSIGGECIYSDTEADFTMKYFYDSLGLVKRREFYNMNNNLIETTSYNYDKTGLIISMVITDIAETNEQKKLIIYRYNHNKNYL